MPDQVLPNNPYARPINATRPEGQMLQGEFYGKRAGDKKASRETGGRQVSPANRYAGRAIAVPVDMDAPPEPSTPKRQRGPKADKVIVDEPVSTVETAITEDDLFG